MYRQSGEDLPSYSPALASLRVHADFLCHFTALDVEGVAQAGSTGFFLQLFIGDLAGMRLQG